MVDAIRRNEGYSMVAAPIFDECKSFVEDFGKFAVEHCFRKSNSIAHKLARWGHADSSSRWVDTLPDFIVIQLTDDVSIL